jgi:hypothetical protein
MWKKAVVGAAAVLVAGSMMVYAQQQRFGGPGAAGGMMGSPLAGWRPSADDMGAFADARIAALHAGLRLTTDQEKSWPAFEQALRDAAKIRIERMTAARDQQPSANPIERMQRRADAMTTRGTALKHLADTAAPLYQSLDDAQKQRFAMLARFLRPHEQRGGMEHRGMWRERFGRMQGGDGLRRFGDGDPMHGQRGSTGRDDEDYRGPL